MYRTLGDDIFIFKLNFSIPNDFLKSLKGEYPDLEFRWLEIHFIKTYSIRG